MRQVGPKTIQARGYLAGFVRFVQEVYNALRYIVRSLLGGF